MCERCTEWCRVPMRDLELGIHVLCPSCYHDDVAEAKKGVPKSPPKGRTNEYARWHDGDIPEWTNQGRGEKTKQ